MEKQKDLRYLLETYAVQMSGNSSGKTPLECAQMQGWVDADGNVTPEGKEAAKAFGDQEKTRSVFRIG